MRKEYSKPEIRHQVIQLGVFGNYTSGPDDGNDGDTKPRPVFHGLRLNMD
jgi:hypothetical protein